MTTIEELRDAFAKVDRIDPSSETYKKLIAYLDVLDYTGLRLLANANIRWISMLAGNRVSRMLQKMQQDQAATREQA